MDDLPAGRRASGVIVKQEDAPAEALESYPIVLDGPIIRIYKRQAKSVAEELTGLPVKVMERKNHPNACILEVKFPGQVLGFRAGAWFDALAKLKGYLDKTQYVRPPRNTAAN